MSIISYRARVRVILEVDADGSWGDDCKVSQIHGQATDAVRGCLDELLVSGKNRYGKKMKVRSSTS